MNWTSVKDKLPEVTQENEYSEFTSGPVLVYHAKWGTMCVAAYRAWDIDEPVFVWNTCDSEGWDITDEVTHWMPLPSSPA